MMAKRRGYIPDGRKAAAAIRYRMGVDIAPRVVAKGAGKIAERIMEAANAAGIPIREDPDLLALLMTLDLNEYIPPELYTAVADVLVFVHRMNQRAGEKAGRRR